MTTAEKILLAAIFATLAVMVVFNIMVFTR